jgi:hypothetical protein
MKKAFWEDNMARKERWQKNLRCPDCDTSVIVEFEENENPVYHGGDLDTKMTSISNGFSSNDNGQTIHCRRCNRYFT